jgi:transcriptional/translational regulatory protein YebC/TACO1
MYFNRGGGALGKTGSLDFLFTRKGVFKIEAEGQNLEDLELELIDFGLDSIVQDEEGITIYTAFTEFGTMQKALEEKHLKVKSAELQRIPNTYTELDDEQEVEVLTLVEKMEEDDDVQAVYHNLKD